MTDEEKKAIENIKKDIKYADLTDLVDDDCTVCFVEDLETILNLLEKQDNRIKAKIEELDIEIQCCEYADDDLEEYKQDIEKKKARLLREKAILQSLLEKEE